jgi:hypothetical protein
MVGIGRDSAVGSHGAVCLRSRYDSSGGSAVGVLDECADDTPNNSGDQGSDNSPDQRADDSSNDGADKSSDDGSDDSPDQCADDSSNECADKSSDDSPDGGPGDGDHCAEQGRGAGQ